MGNTAAVRDVCARTGNDFPQRGADACHPQHRAGCHRRRLVWAAWAWDRVMDSDRIYAVAGV